MKRFIYKISVFVIIFIIINILYLGLIAFTDWNFKKRIESLKLVNPTYELLILGNSSAMDAFDTEYLTFHGLKSYNLAIGGSSFKTNYIQLNEYLTKYKKTPKNVILGIGSYMGSFNGETIHPIVEFTMTGYKFTKNDLPLVKFQWLGSEFVKKIISSTHRNAKLSNGQLKFQKKVPDVTQYAAQTFNINYYLDSYYTGEIARLCSNIGIELIIVEMPGYRNTQNDTEVGPKKLYFKNGATAILYNFNSKDFCKIFNSEDDWIGNSHLNEYGATKFTKEIFNVLYK